VTELLLSVPTQLVRCFVPTTKNQQKLPFMIYTSHMATQGVLRITCIYVVIFAKCAKLWFFWNACKYLS